MAGTVLVTAPGMLAMTSSLLSVRIRNSLLGYGKRTVVEGAGGQWQLDGTQLLDAATVLLETLKPHTGRPLIAYLRKSPLYYVFVASSFLHSLDFCPLDIDNPMQRVLDVAGQLAGSLILCDNDEILAELHKHTPHCLKIDIPLLNPEYEAVVEKEEAEKLDASYYIATSGSTGIPKLVQVPHDRTIPFIDWAVPFYEIDQNSRWGQFSSIGFDLSLVDFLSVVCGGGTLISLSAPMDRIRPATTVFRNRITHWHSVPSMIPYFLRERDDAIGLSTCRLFTFCGEPLIKADAARLAERYPGARIINTYGPTEATLFCSFFEYQGGDAGTSEASLPIGQAIPSWNFVLLPEDNALRLIILSENVAKGYVGISSPQFATVDLFGMQTPAFDTGDYFRMVGTNLYFSHRKDTMVKLNGNRIDLGEIEAAAKRSGLVNPVAVVVKNAIALVAEGNACEESDIMAELSRYLPRASLPAEIRFVPLHPRTVSGKLDRLAIRDAFGDNHGR